METSLSATRAVTWVRTSAVFAPRLYPNASLYQDRLGTNIGKAQKGGAFFAGITNAIYGNRTMLRAAAALAAAQRAAAAAQPPATAVQQLRLKQAMLNVLWCGTRPFQKSYFILKPEHFNQDRLGTNIGKAIKFNDRGVFSQGNPAAMGWSAAVRRRQRYSLDAATHQGCSIR
jgi:hypothetical protein